MIRAVECRLANHRDEIRGRKRLAAFGQNVAFAVDLKFLDWTGGKIKIRAREIDGRGDGKIGFESSHDNKGYVAP